MAPAGNPEIVVAVVLDEPKVAARDGGTVAAPVFREIAQNILQEMKVASDAPVKQDAVVAKVVPESTSKSAEIKSLPAESKPESGAKAKPAESPAVKPKPKDIKKTNDKKFGDTGKLTAFLFRRFNLHDLSLILNTKLET